MTATETPIEVLADLAEPTTRQIKLTPASSIKIRPVLWLWEQRIALGTLALIAGREGIGKSTVAYQGVADITRGKLKGAFHGQPRAVVVAATEDSWEMTIVPRLMAAGADLDLVYRVDVETAEGYGGSLVLPADFDELEAVMTEVNAAELLLDPLLSRLDGRLDTHKDADVRQALEPLVALADRCQASIVGLIHVNKSGRTNALDTLMASRAFSAVARSVLYVIVDPDDQNVRIVGLPKNNLGRTDIPSLTFTIESKTVAEVDGVAVSAGRIIWSGERSESINDLLESEAESGAVRSQVRDAADWLLGYLNARAIVSSQIVKVDGLKEGYKEHVLKRARVMVKAEVFYRGFPKISYWTKSGMTQDDFDEWSKHHLA